MQTHFSAEQLTDSAVAESEKILRSCVHCGFCTATCPTYVMLGNELDSPRGRIYLIKDMLENDRPADETVVRHIDRCLSCLSCMTTCPSGVHYMHLVDHARAHIEKTYKRPLMDRFVRNVLAMVLPYPDRFRAALRLARLGRPFRPVLKRIPGLGPFAAMLDLAAPLERQPITRYTIRIVDDNTLEVDVSKDRGLNALFVDLTNQGIEVLSMRNKTNRLEELFIRMVGGAEGTPTQNAPDIARQHSDVAREEGIVQ